MTHDVVFLTSGRAPMRREEFAANFRAMMEIATIEFRSNVQEITVSGDLAICWILLEVSFTPTEGGETRKHVGNVLTAFPPRHRRPVAHLARRQPPHPRLATCL